MRTEADLRAALAELADTEPSVAPADDGVRDLPRPVLAPTARRRRRRWLAPVGASAAVVAVVAGTIALHLSSDHGVEHAASPKPHPSPTGTYAPLSLLPPTPPANNFSFDPSKPWQACRVPASASYPGIVMHPTSDVMFLGADTCGNGVRVVEGSATNSGTATIEYLPAGMFATGLLTGAPTDSGNGISGWTVSDVAYNCLIPQRDPCTLVDGMVWEYASGAYAIGYGTVQPDGDPVSQAVVDRITSIAGQVDPTSSASMMTPVAFTDRPVTLRMLHAGALLSSSRPGIDVQLGVPGFGADCPADTTCTIALDVDLLWDTAGHPSAASLEPDQTGDGVLRGTCGHFTFDASGSDPITPDQLRQIVLGMRCATSADQSTWQPLTS